MVLVTRVTKLLGIRHPVIQGGMHYVGYAELASAVSNAGGLGIITALTQPTPEDLRNEIRKCKSLTQKPFGVNLTLLPVGVTPDYEAYCRVIIEEKVKIVETAGRNPKPYIELFKKEGIVIIHKCVAVKHALTAERLGVDIISMDGYECGGHPGEEDVTNFILLSRASEVLKIPFVASGGIANGSQLAAAIMLGAEGINMGTRFMATVEAPVHKNIKEAIVKATENDTTHIFRTLSNTERVFKNKTALEVRKLESEFPGDFEKIRHLVLGKFYKDSFQVSGDTESSVWSCGQSIGLIHDIPTCAVLLENIIKEAEDKLNRGVKLITQAKL
jgi:nitronate monooxygenase